MSDINDLSEREQDMWVRCWIEIATAAIANPKALPVHLRDLPSAPDRIADNMITALRARSSASSGPSELANHAADLHFKLEGAIADNKRLNEALRDARIAIARSEVHTLHTEDDHSRWRWANDRGAKLIASNHWGDDVAEDLFPGVPTDFGEVEAAWRSELAEFVRKDYLPRCTSWQEAREEACFTHGREIALLAFPLEPTEDRDRVLLRLDMIEGMTAEETTA